MASSNAAPMVAILLVLMGIALYIGALRYKAWEFLNRWAAIATILGLALALYLLAFQDSGSPTVTPTMAATPTLTAEALRTEAFRVAALQYHVYINPEAGLYRRAQSDGRGFALSNEFEFKIAEDLYVGQVYMNGILYVKKGLWDDMRSTTWDMPGDIVEKEVVRVAGQQKLLTLNMDSAHMKHAQSYNLGYPVTSEFKFSDGKDWYTGQLFLIGLVYIKEGDIFGRHWTVQ